MTTTTTTDTTQRIRSGLYYHEGTGYYIEKVGREWMMLHETTGKCRGKGQTLKSCQMVLNRDQQELY